MRRTIGVSAFGVTRTGGMACTRVMSDASSPPESSSIRNAFDLLAGVRRIAQRLAIDDLALRVGEEGQRHLPLPVLLDLLDEAAALFCAVGTDRVEKHRPSIAKEVAQPGNLPGAVRSPEAAIEDQDDFPAAPLGERHAPSGVVGEREIRSELANSRRRLLRLPWSRFDARGLRGKLDRLIATSKNDEGDRSELQAFHGGSMHREAPSMCRMRQILGANTATLAAPNVDGGG